MPRYNISDEESLGKDLNKKKPGSQITGRKIVLKKVSAFRSKSIVNVQVAEKRLRPELIVSPLLATLKVVSNDALVNGLCLFEQ